LPQSRRKSQEVPSASHATEMQPLKPKCNRKADI
jgi:hypothetical protein